MNGQGRGADRVRHRPVAVLGPPPMLAGCGGAAFPIVRQDRQASAGRLAATGIIGGATDHVAKRWPTGLGLAMPMAPIVLGVVGSILGFGLLGRVIGAAPRRRWRAGCRSGAAAAGPGLIRRSRLRQIGLPPPQPRG